MVDIVEALHASTILDSGACRGAFQFTDSELVSLTPSDAAVCDDARRTKDVWSCLAECVPDVDTIIAKRDTGLSIASVRGGVILETSAPVNIGMLRVALRHEELVQFDDENPAAFAAGGTRALWNLANWIEMIETSRHLRVDVGAKAFTLWAHKGKFGLPDGLTLDDVTKTVLSANESGAAVTMTYDVSTTATPDKAHEPMTLFGPVSKDADEWRFDVAGVPTMCPQDTTLKTTGRMLALHARLQSWGAGQPFEITVLRDGCSPTVVADGKEPNQIRILTRGHA